MTDGFIAERVLRAGAGVGAGPGSLVRGRRARGRAPVLATTAGQTLAVGLVAVACLVALVAPFLGRYGWDRDELYYLSAAHHPALGYVDFPPLIAWIGWLVQRVAPGSLVALRCVSLALGALSVVLVVFIARELGGGWRAQLLTGVAWALTPYVLGSGSIFHPTWTDEVCWVAFLFVATRLVVREDARLWPVLGAIAGVGMESKYTIAFLVAAFVLALVLGGRWRLLGGVAPWVALGIAAVLVAPNVAWQVAHGWPSLHFISSQNAQTAADTSRPGYVGEQVLFLGATTVLAVAGVVWLWRAGLRALAWVPVLVFLAFLVERGRAYYPLPADAVAVAAGAVGFEAFLARRAWGRRGDGRRRSVLIALAAVQAAVILFVAPIVVPLWSTRHMISSGVWKQGFFKDEIGWPELARSVEAQWAALPASERAGGAVLAQNYGEASALEFYGRGLGPVLSGHLNWQYWRPSRLPQRFVLAVGFDQAQLQQLCARWRPAAVIDNRWELANQERGRVIARCVLPAPLGELWSRDVATDQL